MYFYTRRGDLAADAIEDKRQTEASASNADNRRDNACIVISIEPQMRFRLVSTYLSHGKILSPVYGVCSPVIAVTQKCARWESCSRFGTDEALQEVTTNKQAAKKR
jgi:hypothetical protein